MCEFEVSFGTLIGAAKHQWKTILVSLLLFSLIGAGGGRWYASRTAVDQFFHADALEFVDLKEIEQDRNYYQNRQNILSRSCTNVQTYLNGILSVTTLTKEDQLLLKQQLDEVELFNQNTLIPIANQLNAVDAIYVPEDYIPMLIQEYENNLASVQRNLIASEQAVELLKTMDAPTLEHEAVLNNYNALLSRAYSYGTYLMQKEQYTQLLQKLEDTETIRSNNREITKLQDAAARELNALIGDVNEQAAKLAEERLLNIKTTYDDNDALSVVADHTYRATTTQENFLVVWSFCTLTGLCFGAFLAVCREAGAFSRWNRSKKGA